MICRKSLLIPMLMLSLAACSSTSQKQTSSSDSDISLDDSDEFADVSDDIDDEIALEEGDDLDSDLSGSEDGLEDELAGEELGDAGAEVEAALTPDNSYTPPIEPTDTAPVYGATFDEPAVASSPEAAVSEVDITDLRYQADRNGGTVVIETSAPAVYRTREIPDQNQVVIEIANARLPDRLKRPYVTKDFKQEIASINAYQGQGATTARIVIQMRQAQAAAVAQDGRSLLVTAEGGGAVLAGSEGLSSSDSEFDDDTLTRASESDRGANEMARGAGGRPLAGSSLDDLISPEMRFYGKPLSIEVRDTNVRDVLNFIAEQSGANLVVADEVKGNVSLKLREVPWDQALMILMKAKQLGYVRQGNILRIAPLTSLQEETENARKVLDAQRLAQPLRVKVVPVSYAKVADLEKQVAPFLSPRGKAVADVRTSSLVITDIVESIDRVTNLVKALDSPPLQVLIEGKVVEAQDTFSQQLGLNWGMTGATTEIGGNLTMQPSLNVTPVTNRPQGGLSASLSVGSLDVLGDITAFLELAEREDQVKVLSSPRVVAMNNEKASISQSTQILIPKLETTTPTGGAAGVAQQIVYEYKDIPLSLEVLPQITPDGGVIMQVEVKREFAGAPAATNQPPPINKRTATTRVLVKNGQTAVIGGIYQSDSSTTEQGVPWLRRIPLVGWLFKFRNRLDSKNELLIFLTPRILNAQEGSNQEVTL